MMIEEVQAYISENIYHSAGFTALKDAEQRKAIKHASSQLYLFYKAYREDRNPLPIEAIAYQTLWIVAQDESILKANLGLASQSIDGMTQSFAQMDRTIAPEVKQVLKKRVGSYSLPVSNTRRGLYY